jgi:hypothetical protein
MLADPQVAMQAMKAGLVNVDDLSKMQGQQSMQNMLAQAMKNGIPGQGGASGGMQLSSVKMDSSGNPMLDFSPQQVKRWMVDPTGRFNVGVDDQGNEITRMPAGPDARAPEDVPLPPSSLSDMRDRNGRMLPPGTTLRQAQAMGATTSPKPAEADKKNMMLLQDMNDAEKTIAMLSGADTSSVTNSALSSVPGADMLASQDFKKYKAAGSRWAQNYLYLKSGAQASEKEVDVTFRTFFPQPGDSDAVKEQKAIARAQEAGNIAGAYSPQSPQSQGLPAGIPAGSRQIGTSGGKPVYQTPDGQQLIVK